MLRILEKSVRFSLDLEDEGCGVREEGRGAVKNAISKANQIARKANKQHVITNLRTFVLALIQNL